MPKVVTPFASSCLMINSLIALILLVSGVANAARSFSSCEELAIGDTMRVEISDGKSKTKLRQNYTLKRVNETNYDAYINLEFHDYNEEKEIYEKKALAQDEMNVVRTSLSNCYRLMAPAMRDEKGRSVRVKLYDEATHTDIPAPAVQKIWYSSEFKRANASLYYKSMRCDIAVHEAYHLLGLVDEYVEEWKEYNPDFFARMFGRKYVAIEGEDAVAEKPIFDCRAKTNPRSMMSNNFQIFSAHVNAIIYPNCQEKNEIYYACAKNAERTSKKNGGLPWKGGCKKMPDICHTDEWIKVQD
jgi:hypothetical protein